jgi:AraC-like DNA-binding protein
MEKAFKEVIPLNSGDCFTVFFRKKSEFNYPLHYHDEMEINLIINGKGIKRVVGNHEESVQAETELVLLGSNINHGWFKEESSEVTEITIQFDKNLFSEKLLQKRQLLSIKKLFENSRHGLLFPPDAAAKVLSQIIELKEKSGHEAIFQLLSILQRLSQLEDVRFLSEIVESQEDDSRNASRVSLLLEYLKTNFNKQVRMKDVATHLNISESLISQITKKYTSKTYIEILNEIRTKHVATMLVETTHTISEIAYASGFSNFANFHRIFKKQFGCSPSEYRAHIRGLFPMTA